LEGGREDDHGGSDEVSHGGCDERGGRVLGRLAAGVGQNHIT
jgi:hypothetical protein